MRRRNEKKNAKKGDSSPILQGHEGEATLQKKLSEDETLH